jgi:DNA mismatch repair protein PMS2
MPDTKDLFLIDQHASDEKFKYENLIRDTEIIPQNLIKPIDLELNAIEK